MRAVFVADAHIKGADDPIQEELAAFFDELCIKDTPDRLVLLGDIFDFWMFTGEVYLKEYEMVLEALKLLSSKGVGIIYLEGNHDFRLKEYFTPTLGARVYADSGEMELDKRRFFLSHGDNMDMGIRYVLWRAFLRSSVAGFIARALPESTLWKIGTSLSGKSRSYSSARGNAIERHLLAFAKRRILHDDFDNVVMAHSHKPSVIAVTSAEKEGFYANPGSFAENGSYLVYEDGSFTLKRFELRTDQKKTPEYKRYTEV